MDYINYLRGRGLNQTEKLIYICLINNYRYHKKEFYTYERFLADKLEVDERTIRRGIKRLKELELIGINKVYNKEMHKTLNYYTVKTPYEENNSSTEQNNKLINTGFTA